MATHSPIMLSDIYPENVVLLQRDESGNRVVVEKEDMKTFGQNIHDLYRDSFFLESTRGEYASKTIDCTIKTLYDLSQVKSEQDKAKQEKVKQAFFNSITEFNNQTDEEFKIYLKKIIDSFGETLISKKLTALYNEVFREDIDLRIRQLEKEIENLKAQKGDNQ